MAAEVCLGCDREILFSIVASANQMKRFSDAGEFLELVQPFLLRREAEHCLILGLLDGLRAGEQWGTEPPLMALVENHDETAAVVLMTPPHNTDLANPISNHVYQRIGYEPVIDATVYSFSQEVRS